MSATVNRPTHPLNKHWIWFHRRQVKVCGKIRAMPGTRFSLGFACQKDVDRPCYGVFLVWDHPDLGESWCRLDLHLSLQDVPPRSKILLKDALTENVEDMLLGLATPKARLTIMAEDVVLTNSSDVVFTVKFWGKEFKAIGPAYMFGFLLV